ncbi:MAG TPA: hypothetical protein VL527_10720 [Dongiaceae bacterium]|nr:hypothetical protein [Dongiaceae bacterium]
MKSRILFTLLALAGAGLARADFNPVPLTPGSFTADVIVEKSAPRSVSDYTTLTMDGGTNNNSWVWMEQGIDPNHPTTGLPPAGTSFTAVDDVNHSFMMPASYATNDAVTLAGNGITTATLTVNAPTPATAISLLNAGGGASTIDYTIHYQGGGTESGQLTVNDWHNLTATPVAWICNGRFNTDNGQTGEQYTGKPRMFYTDISLGDTVNPVQSITFATTNTSRVVIFGLSSSTDGTTFTPLAIGGFNRDVVVEASVPVTGSLYGHCNVIMDSGGTNITGNTWYEMGFNTGAPTTGLPAHGSNVSGGSPLHTFTMPADYTTNDVLYLGNFDGYQTGTFTLDTPAPYTSLSILGGAGNGPLVASVTVHFADDSTESYNMSVEDWFNGSAAFYASNGRFNPNTLALNDVNSGNPRLRTNDIALVSTLAVKSIDFTYVSGGRAMLFAVAGQTTAGGAYAPVAVTGYNADGIVETGVARFPHPFYAAVNASMDGGTNRNGNTWYEKGYSSYWPNSGLPAAGSIIDSLAQPDHHYQMPADYTQNNCIFVDTAHTTANLTLATPAAYSAVSFLSATANGSVTNQAIMQYADGTAETNTFISRDWFNNTPVAYYANGRVNLDTGTLNTDPGRATAPSNPRLYEAQFALGNTVSPLTNVIVNYLNPTNSNSRGYIFAVSATAGSVPPIIASVSVDITTPSFEGSNLVFNAIITGGSTPITYQWQKGTNGVYVDMVDDARVSGATTTNMTITGDVWTDQADYRLVASNLTGPVNSGIVTVSRVYSSLPDVTAPTDAISIISGTTPAGAEVVSSAINNTIQKYLNYSTTGNTTPFVGPVGFTVKPGMGNTIVNALRIYTANDSEARDPANYVLEGSQDGNAFSAIASGPLALPAGRNTTTTDAINPLTQNVQELHFANSAGYNFYRVTFNTVKDAANANSMQIGEIELLGAANPNPPPNFTVSPTDVAANEGTTATFTSLAVGAAPLTYQWYDVTAGDPGTLLPGKTGANLQLASVTQAQNGSRYRVVATNPYGSVTNPAPALPGVILTVDSGPVTIITDLPAEALFYAGRTEHLTIGVTGTSPTYQWYSNGVALMDGGRVSGATSSVLTLSNLQLTDAATYHVSVSNEVTAPQTSSDVAVYVTAIPTFHTNGVGWQLVAADGNFAYFSGEDTLVLTDQGNEARANWFKTPMNIDAFQASYVYQDVGGGGADGCGFVIQNSTQGTNAVGGGGGGMAYNGIDHSAAVLFNIYNQSGLAFSTNGNAGTYAPTAPVNLAGGDPIQVNLGYDGAVLTVTLSNLVDATTFTTNMAVGSLATTVGTNVAFIGITGASGGVSSTQQASHFQYIPVPTLAAQPGSGAVTLTWPDSIGGYSLQSAVNVATPAWSALATGLSQTNGQNQVTVPATNGAAFYRLTLPTP